MAKRRVFVTYVILGLLTAFIPLGTYVHALFREDGKTSIEGKTPLSQQPSAKKDTSRIETTSKPDALDSAKIDSPR